MSGTLSSTLPALAEWGEIAPAVAILIALAVFAALFIPIRRRLRLLQAAAQARERKLASLADAFERLSRVRDPLAVVDHAESMCCALLQADSCRVQVGEAAAGEQSGPDGMFRRSRVLAGATGKRLGCLTVQRADGRPFAPEDAMVLEHIARAIAAALENANLFAEAMRARSEVELILSTISDGMFVLDRAWYVRYVNHAASRYLRRPREDMLGAVLWSTLPGLRETEFGERCEQASRTALNVDFSSYYAPLSAWFEVRCYPFSDGLTVYFRDVTAQREIAEKLRQSQKLESLGQLTGGIAHDVNNLLTVILGNFEMLAMSAEEREEAGLFDLDLAEAGLRAGDSASQLMHRLLAFSRRQPLSPRVVSVGDLLSSLEPLLQRTIGEHVNLRIQWQSDLWSALIDPIELENAILNLALNARDAMPSGGRLAIGAANVQIDRVYAAVAGLDRTGDYIMVTVADSGIGMHPHVLARAFDPFFTTKQPGQGTGLGLSMVHGFAHQSGGHVMIDSEPGQGTIIRLYLPRTTGEDPLPRDEPDLAVAGGHETILLVEDNDQVRNHTETMLHGLGYTVVAAADGPAALLLLQEGLRPDLLLTDVVLPQGMTGRDVADAAAKLVLGLRVLFISGYSGDVLLENGRVGVGVELITKPFRRAELASRIRARLSGPPWRGSHAPASAGGAPIAL